MNQEPPVSPHKQRNRMIVLAIVSFILIVVAAITIIMTLQKGSAPTNDNQSKAKDVFYNALANAAEQPRLHIAMLRKTFANNADAKADANGGIVAASVSEIDMEGGKFQALYANKGLGKAGFALGACLNNTDYTDGLNESSRSTSLAEANKRFSRLVKPTDGTSIQFGVCERVGLYPSGVSIDLAPARLSDGVFPVTFQNAQANSWKEQVRKADLFDVRDEGEQSYQGKAVRKISFAPKKDQEMHVNKKLYDIFYEVAGIGQLKQENRPEVQYDYAFITINPANSGGVKGYYLIDTAAKLPVYSQLEGINSQKEAGEADSISRLHIATTKQAYTYPAEMSLTQNSRLELLE